jgi:hypothetical protein
MQNIKDKIDVWGMTKIMSNYTINNDNIVSWYVRNKVWWKILNNINNVNRIIKRNINLNADLQDAKY